MPSANPKPSYALSLWFLGIALLGLVQGFGKAHRNGYELNAIAWAWLIGSLALLALSLVLAWCEYRRGKS